jgi:lytic murein transglycosylase
MYSRLSAAVLAGLWALSAQAQITEASLRPQLRPASLVIDSAVQTALKGISLRPVARPQNLNATVTKISTSSSQNFDAWIEGFKPRARAQGIKDTTLSHAFRGISYDADVIRRDRNQSEFTKTIWDYLDTAVSDARVKNGKAALAKQRMTLDRIESEYGVEKEIVTAIWGLESAYGSFRGSNSTIESLATLAYDGRRSEFFEVQLMAALRILQNGDVTASRMKGSWAGAMGHTQFMPTSFEDHAVDFTRDGKRDIWSDDPTDALASTAAYLKHFGWTKGQPWGVEVTIPRGFDYQLAQRKITKNPAQWAKIGIKGVGGQPVKDHGKASILLPAGGRGAAFMIFDNFEVLERYNTADAYVIGVGHLADRIAGGAPIRGAWPREDRALTYDERIELQTLLTRNGFDTQKIDGKIGPLTIAAVRSFQTAKGMLPDGYASLRILQELR